MVGAILSIADKIDTICGCFSIGLIPTGASDPYALRRQGIGVLQIMHDKGFMFSLSELIGESLNVINRVIGKAFREKDPVPIAEEAKRQKAAGMDWIDINLGPARKGGPELMEFVVKTVQEAIGDTPPLCLDTSNIEAMEAGLSVLEGKAIINSIMVRPERYEKMIPLAVQYKANMIALMWGPEGLPRDENERAALAVEIIYAANEAGVPNEDIFVDGIVTPVNIQQPQLMSLLAFQEMLKSNKENWKSVRVFDSFVK